MQSRFLLYSFKERCVLFWEAADALVNQLGSAISWFLGFDRVSVD